LSILASLNKTPIWIRRVLIVTPAAWLLWHILTNHDMYSKLMYIFKELPEEPKFPYLIGIAKQFVPEFLVFFVVIAAIVFTIHWISSGVSAGKRQ